MALCQAWGSTKAGSFTSLDSAGASLQLALEEVDSERNKRYNHLLVICRKLFLFLWLKIYQFLIVLDKGLRALISSVTKVRDFATVSGCKNLSPGPSRNRLQAL